MAITPDARSQAAHSGTGTNLAHVIGAGSTILLVGLMFGQSEDEASVAVTWNGTALTEVYHSGAEYWDCYIFALYSPAAGSYNIAYSWTNSAVCTVHAISLKGTLTASAIRDSDGSTGTDYLGASTQSRTLDASATDYLFSVGAGQNVYLNSNAPLTDFGDVNTGGHYGTGADGACAGATVSMSWTQSGGNRWGFGGVTIKASEGGGQFICFE